MKAVGCTERLHRWIAAACLLLACHLAHALDPQRQIGQFHHTAWTVKEGAPGQVTALAQTTDGYLWLATQVGLFRFDGVQFERYEPPGEQAFPATSISTLHATADGGLWIGFRYGAVSFLREGRLTHYGEAQGLPTSTVFRFAQGPDGRLWAATFSGLVYLHEGRWYRAEREWRVPGTQARTLFADRDGTLWLATDAGIARLRKGTQAFETIGARVGRISQIAQAPDGALWIAENEGGVRRLSLDGATATPVLSAPSAGLLFDRDGTLWATTMGEGVRRLSRPSVQGSAKDAATFESFRQDDGLSADYLLPVLEDREGTIWVGSSRGLDRFRHTNVIPAMLPDGAQDFAIVAGPDGTLLAGSRNRPLMVLDGTRVGELDLPAPLTAAHRDRDGTVWLGGPGGLWAWRDGRATPVTPLPVSGYSGVQAIAHDANGVLWVSLNTPGIHRLEQGRWRQLRGRKGLPPGSSPLVLLPAADGALWMGYARNQIAVMRGDAVQAIGSADGLDVGNVTALLEGQGGIWIGGERGLAHYAQGKVRTLRAPADSPFRGITGIVQTRGGDLWLNGALGVVHVKGAEVPHLFEAATPRYEQFDFLDGMPGVPAQFRPIPTAAEGRDGRVWFATTSGVVAIDPAAIRRNPTPPPVTVLSLAADERMHRVHGDTLRLPPGTRNLQIAYTALSLSIPERVRFRYKLEGYDDGWQDAGTRRTAFYNDPGPGAYVFRVVAANNDGVWNEVGASLPIVIAPRYYQTPWFRALSIILGVSLLWIAYLLRLRHLSAQIRERLQERHRERERIARELHDTLLQSVQGLILRFHAVAESLGRDAPSHAAMERVLQRADDVMGEARDRVLDLRAHAPGELPEMLADLGEELVPDYAVDFRMVVDGATRALDPLVCEEVYRIAREAVINAFQHARAGHVVVELAYERDLLLVRVRDDGVGMPPEVVRAGGRSGHWGMPGMRERAKRIGATLDLRSAAGKGTDVVLCVPGDMAYRGKPRATGWWQRLFGKSPPPR
ncbi:sensor histidine kinase [Pseudoxanthomonas sp. PXM02]|uniref:sensor histidine kinase n=1 Tax=Pseudoxanthomonas sp. PXM02 TaxID=2769294 RepID=UPI0017822DEB|nr:sensor histidine kinase [Pseudoxanthomonas sp. PXM02]MBD9478966.1 ATPase [Pseudoxanthomonas sp. PXM02]